MNTSATSTIGIDKVKFTKKVYGWMSNNYDRCEDERDYEDEIEILLNDYQTELGGLIAIRGFVYQYYVGIYYMLKMLHKKDAWWNNVIFELMDDITLIGEDQIRFVQVKTVREEGEANYFTPGNLQQREKGEIGSWLDKLFINYSQFNSIFKNKFIDFTIDEVKVQFEIATNNTYNKDLIIYSNNIEFLLDEKKYKEELDKLSGKLEIPCKKTGDKLQTLVGKNATWCLERFRLHHMDRFMVLKDQIINIIKELSKQDSTDVSEHILKHIFYTVVERTHNDEVSDVNQYVFSRDEVQKMINVTTPAALRNAKDYLHSQDIQSKFVICFEELRNEFMRITSSVKIELLKTLTWIQDELVKKSSEDVFVYVRFLHLLFDMTSSDSERDIKSSTELNALRNSLEIMTLCLTFYIDKEFLLSNAHMITKKGKDNGEARLFTLFHANQSGYFDIICKKVNESIEMCPILQGIHEHFYCFILGSKKRNDLIKPHGVTTITDNYNVLEQEVITDKPSLIKYYDPEFLESVQDYFYNLEDEISLYDSENVISWHGFLNQHGKIMQRHGV